MMVHYVSKYSNQVHQLVVSLSQHLYVIKNNELRYQSKKFDLKMSNIKKSNKKHLLHYFIKDHFSGVIYGETHFADKIFPIEEFLFNAWKKKKLFSFGGIPENLIVPKNVIEIFPDIKNFISNYSNIQYLESTSGFQSGAPIITKEWEKNLSFSELYGYQNFISIQENIESFNQNINSYKSRTDEGSKIDKWKNNISNIRFIEDRDQFFQLFKPQPSTSVSQAGL